MIMIVATFGQTIAAPSYGVSIIGTLIVWRFIVSGTVLIIFLHVLTFDNTLEQ